MRIYRLLMDLSLPNADNIFISSQMVTGGQDRKEVTEISNLTLTSQGLEAAVGP